MKDYIPNRVYPLACNYALVLIEAPDSKKILYNIIEFPDCDFHQENEHIIVASAESLEEVLIKAVHYLGYFAHENHLLNKKIEEWAETLNKDNHVDFKHQVPIDDEFCIKEMGIPKDQMEYFGRRKWNIAFKQKKQWFLGTE